MNFTFHNAYGALIDAVHAVLSSISLHQSLPSVHGQALRKAVAAHGHNADFYFRQIIHVFILLIYINKLFGSDINYNCFAAVLPHIFRKINILVLILPVKCCFL